MRVALGLLTVLLTTCVSAATKLTPQDVVDQVLGKSDRSEQIELENQDAQTELERAKGVYDLMFGLGANYKYDEGEDLSGLDNPLNKTYTLSTSISKPTSFGTTFSFGYNHIEQASVLNPIVTNTRTPNAVFDEVGLTIRQNLWRNFFGKASRLAVDAARSSVREADLKRQEDLENLTLDAMKLFWDAYVAQVQLRDAIASRERYQTLQGIVGRKSRFGLQRGGEAAQVQAEFQDADQKAKEASKKYLSLVDKMKTLLKLELGEKDDVQFVVANETPPIPRLESKELTSLRPLRIAQSSVETARLQERNVSFSSGPMLDLVGSAFSTGVETNKDRAQAEMTSGTKPTYFVGLQFATALDSSGSRADRAKARIDLALENNRLRSVEQTLRDQGRELELKVRANYEIAKSAIEAEGFRARTVREQDSEYRGGRMALIELIRTYNSYLEAQSKRVRAVGDYHIALNELAAFRDELVKEKR